MFFFETQCSNVKAEFFSFLSGKSLDGFQRNKIKFYGKYYFYFILYYCTLFYIYYSTEYFILLLFLFHLIL